MSKYAIICVDDERTVLYSLKKELEDTIGEDYLIEIAENSADAINLFEELTSHDYKIPVVISDHIMPGLKGDELLKTIHERNSRTYKIMLTGHAETRALANAVNNANLFRIITKPWESDELIFTVKEAINNFLKNEYIEKQFLELKRIKELNDTLKKNNFKYNKILEEKKRIFIEVIPSLTELNTVYEPGYFLSHTNFLINFSLKIANEMQLEYDERSSIVILSLLLHKIMQDMPEKFRTVDPNCLDTSGIKEYFTIYNDLIDRLSQNEHLNKFVIILSQLWEHYDGTGLPHKQTFNSLTKLSQIINLAKIYHNGVYSFPEKVDEIFEQEGFISQSWEVTSQRHTMIMQYIFKNSSWYDLDIIDTFQRLVRQKATKEFLIEKSTIKVFAKGDNISVMKFASEELSKKTDKKILVPVEKLLNEVNGKHKDDIIKRKKPLETTMELSDLRPGMITGCDIVTKYGRLIVLKDTMLTIDHIDEITKIKKFGLLNDKNEVRILIPRDL